MCVCLDLQHSSVDSFDNVGQKPQDNTSPNNLNILRINTKLFDTNIEAFCWIFLCNSFSSFLLKLFKFSTNVTERLCWINQTQAAVIFIVYITAGHQLGTVQPCMSKSNTPMLQRLLLDQDAVIGNILIWISIPNVKI